MKSGERGLGLSLRARGAFRRLASPLVFALVVALPAQAIPRSPIPQTPFPAAPSVGEGGSGHVTRARRERTWFLALCAADHALSRDELSRRTSEKDQAGKVTQFQYDKLSRLVKVIDALLQETTYGYDELGNRIRQTDANGRSTWFLFDKLGREIKRVLPDGSEESKTYNAAGNLQTRTDFMGRVTTYDYDDNNRLTTRTYPNPAENVSFSYTATGRRLTAVDARGTTSYGYDLRDRLTSFTQPGVGSLGYGYDGNGNRTSLTATIGADSHTTTYSYDDASRLDLVTDPAIRIYDHGYDANGNRTSLAYPNATNTSYVYNSLNRLTSLSTTGPLGTVQGYTFTLGPAGNRTRIDEADGTIREYGYDNLYRLTSETVRDSIATLYSKTFSYDSVGNRQQQVTTSAGGAGLPAPGTKDYTYDTRDRLLTENANNSTYDSNGNLTAKVGEANYVWNHENRLIQVTNADGTVVDYQYDADSNRVRTTTTPSGGSATTTNYLVDTSGGLSHVVAETDATNTLGALYVRNADDLLSVMRPAGGGTWNSRFFHSDGIGSIRRLTNEAGIITDGYSYEGFGTLLAHTGSDTQPYAFAGEPLDPNSGFQYLRARWMDPRVGRFTGQDVWDGDPFAPVSLHRYLYSDASPTWKADPTGRFSLIGALAITAIIVIVAAIAIPRLQQSSRSRLVAVKWSTDFVFGGARLDTVERQRVKSAAHSAARSAFSGLPLTLIEGGAGRHRLEVVNVPARFAEWGGVTKSTDESDVFYSPHEQAARKYGAEFGFDRQLILFGLGQGLGVTIAHETAHQILRGKPGDAFMDHRGDPATYDYWRDSFSTFFGALKWSDRTLTALQNELR